MSFLSSGLPAALWATALLAIVFAGTVCVGALLLRSIGIKRGTLENAEFEVFSFALGFIAISLLVLALGSFGFLKMIPVCLFIIFIVSLTAAVKCRVFSLSFSRPSIVWLVAGFPLVLSWIQALMPPIAMDALAYHLFLPEQYEAYGRIFYQPMSREALWPFQTEMFFTLGLLLQGASLAQLFHWQFYGLTAAAVYLFTRRAYGAKPAIPAALAFIYTPMAFAQSGSAYVDLSFAFYIFISLYACYLYAQTNRMEWVILAGLLCGGTIGTKMLGLGAVAILFLWLCIYTRLNVRKLVVFSAACILTGGVWYIRSWVLGGNPVLPFFSKYFGGHGYDFAIGANVGMGNDGWAFLRYLWNITLYPRNFGGEILGAIYLVFLPPALFLVGKKTQRLSRMLFGFSVLYSYFLYTQSQHLRFFLSVTPVLCVGVGLVIQWLFERSKTTRMAVWGAIGCIFILHSGIFIYRLKDCWPVFMGQRTAQEHLLQKESTFPGAVYIHKNIKEGEKLFNSGDVRYFYYPTKATAWDNQELRHELTRQGKTIQNYLDEQRFDWILVTQDDTAPDVAEYVRQNPYIQAYAYEAPEKWMTYRYTFYRRQA